MIGSIELTTLARRWFLAKPMAGFRAPIPFWYPILTSRAKGITWRATVADVVSGYDGLDNTELLLLVACQATTEDRLTDSSDPPPEYTKGGAGARALQVDLVVLWDVVGLRRHLEVDGDAGPSIR